MRIEIFSADGLKVMSHDDQTDNMLFPAAPMEILGAIRILAKCLETCTHSLALRQAPKLPKAQPEPARRHLTVVK